MKRVFSSIAFVALPAMIVASWGDLLIADNSSTEEKNSDQDGVRVANVNAFYSGGNTIGGSHPTAAAWSFTVPTGENRLLLVITNSKADSSLNGKKSSSGRSISQRAMLTSLTYAGRELQCMTMFDEATYDDRHAVFWYLPNPPVGTDDLVAIQFPRDNGGEIYAAVYALTGVNQNDPLGNPIRFITQRNQVHTVKCRPGGIVVAEAKTIKLAKPDPAQVVRYANDKSRVGSTVVGSPEVKLSWNWQKQFLTKQGKYRAAPKSGGVVAIAIHPQFEFKKARSKAQEVYALRPLTAGTSNGSERPEVKVTLYDLSSITLQEKPPGINYKRPSYGHRIPERYEKQKVIARMTVPNIDFKYDFKHSSELKYDNGFMGSGVSDNFVAEFTGTIMLPETGQYVFELNSNDQAKLYIGDRLIIDNRGNNAFTMKMASLRIEKGKYAIRAVYVEESWKEKSAFRSHGIRLGWRLPSGYPKDTPIQLWKLEKGVHPIPGSAFTHGL